MGNTIEDPLKVTFHKGKDSYVVNKPDFNFGDLVDLSLAMELEKELKEISSKHQRFCEVFNERAIEHNRRMVELNVLRGKLAEQEKLIDVLAKAVTLWNYITENADIPDDIADIDYLEACIKNTKALTKYKKSIKK